MIGRVLAAAVIVVIAAALAIVAWPQLLGLQREPVIAQIVSLRGLAAALALIAVGALVLVAILSRPARRLAGALVLVVLVFAGVQIAVLATRGGGDPRSESKQDGDIVVLSWNTLGDVPSVETIAELALGVRADVVVLPETSAATAALVADAMAAGGSEMQPLYLSFDPERKARTTSMLVSAELGEYTLDGTPGSTDTLPSLVAVPVDGTGPTLVAAHPVSPVPGEMAAWRQGLRWLAARCAGENVIVAGDLNSTLDHYAGLGTGSETPGGLAGCIDGARATGNGAVGTWPTTLPPLLGAPIDHVLATDVWEFVGFRVDESRDDAGSDHRPVVAHLRPAS
jgi:endonuclease/exonuclease/phosphatase (EEP) superfamily protein YafD